MTFFEPIHYTYVPTAPRSKRATAQEQHIMPNRRSFDDTQRTDNGDDSGSKLQENSDKENVADNNYNFDPSPRYSILQANIEDSSLRSKVWEGKRVSPRTYDDDSSSIETVLDPRLYPGALIEGLQSGDDTQDTLVAGDDKSNSDKQENFVMDGFLSPCLDHSIEPSHPLITHERDQSDSGYSDPEKLENGSSPYFLLQQHGDIAVKSIKGKNNKQQGSRNQQHLSKTDIGKKG